ncbi:unnamed protein product [Closterium sp. NIES-54]
MALVARTPPPHPNLSAHALLLIRVSVHNHRPLQPPPPITRFHVLKENKDTNEAMALVGRPDHHRLTSCPSSSVPTPPTKHPPTRFHVLKENKDTNEAMALVGRYLGVQSRALGFSGTKDKRAVTVQRVGGVQRVVGGCVPVLTVRPTGATWACRARLWGSQAPRTSAPSPCSGWVQSGWVQSGWVQSGWVGSEWLQGIGRVGTGDSEPPVGAQGGITQRQAVWHQSGRLPPPSLHASPQSTPHHHHSPLTLHQVTVSHQSARKVASLNAKLFGIRVGDYRLVDQPLVLGQLAGNHFVVTLRAVRAPSLDAITAAAEGLRSHGIINYFGLQVGAAGCRCIPLGAVTLGDLVLCSLPAATAAATAASAAAAAAAGRAAGVGAEGPGMRGTDAEAEAEEAAAVAVEARAEGEEVRVVSEEEAEKGVYSIDQVVLPLPG